LRLQAKEKLAPTWTEGIFLLVCGGILLVQLFLPGFIGIADNNDFPKVTGPFCVIGVDHSADIFVYFQPDYVHDSRFCYRPGIPSSEIPLAWLAFQAAWLFQHSGHIDIRWMGAIHALIFLSFFYALLRLLRPLKAAARLVLSVAALWIFTDVSIVSYCNTFFMDAAGIFFGLLAAVLAVYLIVEVRVVTLALFGLAAIGFVTSKGPNAVVGVVPLAFVTPLIWRGTTKTIRDLASWISAAMLVGMLWTFLAPPNWYQGQPRFSLVFFRIAKQSATPAKDLHELGLGDADLRYVGMTAYSPDSPMFTSWSDVFCARTSYSRVLAFYLHHPATMLSFLWYDLSVSSRERRQYTLSNFQRSAGRPAGALTQRFAWWSNLRAWLFAHWPAHMLIWYAFVFVGMPLLMLRNASPYRRAIAWTVIGISVMAAGEFGIASLSDACETGRHLIMFHVFTDLAMFLSLAFAAAPENSDYRRSSRAR